MAIRDTDTQTAKTDDLDNAALEEILASLHASRQGLTAEEAARRLGKYGTNELPETSENPLLKFLGYFWGPIPWMIEIAAILSAVLHHWAELVIILVLLSVNALVGFWEEYQAGNTLAALKDKLALKARVLRDGAWSSIPARELVPGDVARLRPGSIVPADARQLGDNEVQVDQSSLTGESLPVAKSMGDDLYAGSVLQRGETDILITTTGPNTYFGRTAHLVQSSDTESHFQRAVLKIGDYLIILAVILVALILSVALFRGDAMLTTLQFALVLTVAAIPVAMPTVLSVTMAVGARILTAKQAIVTKLASIEELAGVDVLCSDKTGTLTKNQLTLGEPFVSKGHTAAEVVLAAAQASRIEDQDPIDDAILAAVPGGVRLVDYKVDAFLPFDPVRKRTEAAVTGPDGRTFKVTKGAPQIVMAMVADKESIGESVETAISEFAERGYRALGVARADEGGAWRLLGILPLLDPPRDDSAATVKKVSKMGVAIKMVTGDQLPIAREIAHRLGLGPNLLDASLFGHTRHHEESALADAIEKADGFAQVFPEHKHHIVDVLQQRGHIVGMTGDGVNDAPGLRKADVGIAVSGATEVARSAADIALLTPGLTVIAEAIRESRRIFQRMRSYAIYRITETIRILLFMTLSILAFNFYPVTAVMIVLLALLNDGAILSIAYDNARGSPQPDAWRMPTVLGVATVLGLMGVVESFGLLYVCERVLHLSQDMIRSLIYLKLSVSGHLTIFVTRTRGPFWSSRPSGTLFWAVLLTQAVATLITVYGLFMQPIGWSWGLAIWGYALFWFLAEDRLKPVAYRMFDQSQAGLLTRRSPGRARTIG
jgi:H+-transporting ATPase